MKERIPGFSMHAENTQTNPEWTKWVLDEKGTTLVAIETGKKLGWLKQYTFALEHPMEGNTVVEELKGDRFNYYASEKIALGMTAAAIRKQNILFNKEAEATRRALSHK